PAHVAGVVLIEVFTPSSSVPLVGELGQGFTYTTTPTTVQSIDRQSPSASLTNASAVTFLVTFDVAATGVQPSNFTVTTVSGSASGGAPTGVSGSGTTWSVTVDTGGGDGVIRLDMINDVGVTPSVTNLTFGSGQTYTIDKTPPSVSSILRATGAA